MVNESILSGLVPDYFKQAYIWPLLRKPGLDPSLPHNYRPISKLPLASEIVEKVVTKQLLEILKGNNIFDKFQSGFRKDHSSETALVRVTNEILTSADAGQTTILILLDLSAAFDTVDHMILLNRLRSWVDGC